MIHLRKSFAKSMGYSNEMPERPIVGIAHTPSGVSNCHRHFPELPEAVKRGVLAAGALLMKFSTISLGGCDKTVPAQLMGAISADLPAIQLVGVHANRLRGAEARGAMAVRLIQNPIRAPVRSSPAPLWATLCGYCWRLVD